MRDRLPLGRLAPAALLALLAVAWLASSVPGLDLATAETDAVDRWTAALDELPDNALVLVAFDPDLGTYAEVRPTVRAAIADLLDRNARLALVSLTPEGRMLARAEWDRLERNVTNPARRIDLGYLPGAEAAIVELARGVTVPDAAGGEIARRLRDDGTAGLDAVVVIGGNEMGPRPWVEQFAPRTEGTPLLAITPTVLLPETLPYLATGQLAALLGTPGDGAAYRGGTSLGDLERLRDVAEPRPLPIAVGLLIVLGVVGVGLLRPAWADGRPARDVGGAP